MVPARHFEIASSRKSLKKMRRVSAGPINVISLPALNSHPRFPQDAKICIVFEVGITTS
jgi:hypothetical protein